MCCQMLYFAFMVLHTENKLLLLGSSDEGSDGMSMGFFWLPLLSICFWCSLQSSLFNYKMKKN